MGPVLRSSAAAERRLARLARRSPAPVPLTLPRCCDARHTSTRLDCHAHRRRQRRPARPGAGTAETPHGRCAANEECM